MSKVDKYSQFPGTVMCPSPEGWLALLGELAGAGGVYGFPSPGGRQSSQVYGCSELYKHTRRMCAYPSVCVGERPCHLTFTPWMCWPRPPSPGEDASAGWLWALFGDLVTLSGGVSEPGQQGTPWAL